MALPAISLVAVPGRRRLTIDLAREAERRGFAGIYTPSMYGNMSQCEAMAWNTERIPFGTAIAPIYARTVQWTSRRARRSCTKSPADASASASGSRTRLAISGWASLSASRSATRAPSSSDCARWKVSASSRPSSLRPCARRWWRWPARSPRAWCSPTSHSPTWRASLAALPGGEAARRRAFFIGNMLPICISDDIEAAKAVCRRNLVHYAFLPNYRNYWKEAGYVEEMTAIEAGDRRWPPRRRAALSDGPLAGGCHIVRAGIARA